MEIMECINHEDLQPVFSGIAFFIAWLYFCGFSVMITWLSDFMKGSLLKKHLMGFFWPLVISYAIFINAGTLKIKIQEKKK